MLIRYGVARAVVDDHGVFIDRAVVDQLQVGDVVRIAIIVPLLENDSDSPYVRIQEFAGAEIRGLITDIGRSDPDMDYPFRTGSSIWFKREHVFQIATAELSKKRREKIMALIHPGRKHVPVNSPLFLTRFEETGERDDGST